MLGFGTFLFGGVWGFWGLGFFCLVFLMTECITSGVIHMGI